MYTLREKLADSHRFLLGVELVSTRGTMADRQALHARTFATELRRSGYSDDRRG